MQKNIYWFCFIRQLRELYMFLQAEKLIDCSEENFLSHFTGKKYPVYPAYIEKIKWYGGNKKLNVLFQHLLEKGFVNIDDIKIYDIIITGINVNDMMNEHFKIVLPLTSSKNFAQKLENLFPATTSYRCKTRLFYKARNKKSISEVVRSLQ